MDSTKSSIKMEPDSVIHAQVNVETAQSVQLLAHLVILEEIESVDMIILVILLASVYPDIML